MRTDGKAVYLMLGLEIQSHIHYAMPVRAMLYDAIEYEAQVQRTASLRSRERESDAFLSGFRKDDKLIPVITLVLYLKPDKWDGPRSLSDMYAPYDEAIKPYINDYSINLISPAELDSADFAQFSTEAGKVLEFIKCSGDKEHMERFIEENDNLRLSSKAVMFLNEITHSKLAVNDERGDVIMCKALDDMCADAREKGRTEGRAEGRTEGERIGRTEGERIGRTEGEARMSRLISLLLSQNNYEEARQAAENSDIRDRLYIQYGIV